MSEMWRPATCRRASELSRLVGSDHEFVQHAAARMLPAMRPEGPGEGCGVLAPLRVVEHSLGTAWEPVQVVRNLLAILREEDTVQPSPMLFNVVSVQLAEQILESRCGGTTETEGWRESADRAISSSGAARRATVDSDELR